jgi:hypothetical protein
MTENDETTVTCEGDLYSFDTSGMDDDTIKDVTETLHRQVEQLARMGIVDLFGRLTENGRFVIGVPYLVSGGAYSADLGQLIAFVMGANAATEAAINVMGNRVTTVDLMEVAVQAFREQMQKGKKNDDS